MNFFDLLAVARLEANLYSVDFEGICFSLKMSTSMECYATMVIQSI